MTTVDDLKMERDGTLEWRPPVPEQDEAPTKVWRVHARQEVELHMTLYVEGAEDEGEVRDMVSNGEYECVAEDYWEPTWPGRGPDIEEIISEGTQ